MLRGEVPRAAGKARVCSTCGSILYMSGASCCRSMRKFLRQEFVQTLSFRGFKVYRKSWLCATADLETRSRGLDLLIGCPASLSAGSYIGTQALDPDLASKQDGPIEIHIMTYDDSYSTARCQSVPRMGTSYERKFYILGAESSFKC